MCPDEPTADSTTPQTPQAKRLSLPELDLPEDWTRDDLTQALANAHMSIARNLQYLREIAERNSHQENANAIAIKQNTEEIAKLTKRVESLEGLVHQT